MGHIDKPMTAGSKMPRAYQNPDAHVEPDEFDFGEPEIICVEISPGKYLSLKEPSANDLIEIYKISEDKKVSEIEATLQTICILHSPREGERKLSLLNAKKLRPKQLKKLGEAIEQLLAIDSKEDSEGEE